ncbi:hypothetical protein E4P39_07490 [Blastococcus sp. CT_GayMR19]|uniref:hypothetical protein n=1 Tax=Blastococcus sp. CT_GayMR19 TaxID=2559608 RepID=UPI0010740F49|nr:hypothetical protein [Blastococcus sp. CT_GayMR19]TFV76741.1 hypothetical protein E4P39_07490 [Blastococcus sp. CT_GayMR19]
MPGRWGSFVADAEGAHVVHEAGNPVHRCRVEHDDRILLVHLSDEDGEGWNALAVERATRRWAVGQDRTQIAAATRAVDGLRERGAQAPGE